MRIFAHSRLPGLESRLLFSKLASRRVFVFVRCTGPCCLSLGHNNATEIRGGFDRVAKLIFSKATCLCSISCDNGGDLLGAVHDNRSDKALCTVFSCCGALIRVVTKRSYRVLFVPPRPVFVARSSLTSVRRGVLIGVLTSRERIFLRVSRRLTYLSGQDVGNGFVRLLRVCYGHRRDYRISLPFSHSRLTGCLTISETSLSETLNRLGGTKVVRFGGDRFGLVRATRCRFSWGQSTGNILFPFATSWGVARSGVVDFIRLLLFNVNLSVSTFTISVYGKLSIHGLEPGRTVAIKL